MTVVFLLPTLNEESGIADGINDVKALKIKSSTILVVDGRSKDRTVEIARRLGAKVMVQRGKGKGNAIIEAIETLKPNDIVLMVDADGTYDLSNARRMLGLVDENTMVFGNRVFTGGNIKLLNRIGNFGFNTLVMLLYMHRVSDLLTGLRAFKVSRFRKLGMKAQGFDTETEMTLKAIRHGVKIIEIPTEYRRRLGETKLLPLKDGLKIFKRIIKERLAG